ncbi:MAG: OB-fold domain-containing protein [Dehalococcoidia bacterium]
MPNRPQPALPEHDTDAFWEGVQKNELRYQTCNECKEVVFTPRAHCTKCGSGKLTTKVSKGTGTVYTYSVVRQSRHPNFADLGAYSVAYVDLDEGFRMLSSIVGVNDPTTEIKIGMPVKVEFEKQDTGDYPIPVFRPV